MTDKPNLLTVVLETIATNPAPDNFKITDSDIQKIVDLCEQFKFVSTNRQEFRNLIEQTVNEILARND